MKYSVSYTSKARKILKKLDPSTSSLILSYIEAHLVDCEDPRRYGKPLKGELSEQWRYRVGNYRILAKIIDDEIVILIVTIGHRRDIYK